MQGLLVVLLALLGELHPHPPPPAAAATEPPLEPPHKSSFSDAASQLLMEHRWSSSAQCLLPAQPATGSGFSLAPPRAHPAGHAAAQAVSPNVPFWRIKPSLHINGVMRYRIWLNGRALCSANTYGGGLNIQRGMRKACERGALVCVLISLPFAAAPLRRLPHGAVLYQI